MAQRWAMAGQERSLSTIYTNGGAIIAEVNEAADEVVALVEAATAAGEAWIWLHLRQQNALYGPAESRFQPLAVRTHDVAAVAGPRACGQPLGREELSNPSVPN